MRVRATSAKRTSAESILEALVNGESIEAPPLKKRGRKRKEPATAEA
jgi:hypothetical protein